MDKEPPREDVRTFTSSRGEFSLQPSKSGHYTWSFTQISDAYYKVALSGPSIDQVIHPLAHAEFVAGPSGGRGKKQVSSCEGGFVDVDVDLRVSYAWLSIYLDLTPSRELDLGHWSCRPSAPRALISSPFLTLKHPGGLCRSPSRRRSIRKAVLSRLTSVSIRQCQESPAKYGVVSVEDKYKCKKTLSIPAVSVNVYRVKVCSFCDPYVEADVLQPIAKFYGERERRRVTVLEREPVNIPLRLTGEDVGAAHVR